MKSAHVAAEVAARWQRWADAAMGAAAMGAAAMDAAAGGSGPDLDDLAAHLANCPACRAEADAWAAAFGALDDAALDAELPPAGFVAGVLASLPAESPAELARKLSPWQGLGLAAAVWLGLVFLGSIGSLIWAPGWLADVLAAALNWVSFWFRVFARLWGSLDAGLDQWRLLTLLHPARAAAGALLAVAGWILYAIYRMRIQTFSLPRRTEG